MDTKKSTMATPTLETFANQTQIFASAWSLINSPFGGEDSLELAEVERGILLDMARRLIEDHDAARQEIASLRERVQQLEAVGAGGVGSLVSVPDECPHLIWYDDQDRKPEMFASHGARDTAMKRFHMISQQWNAHLFVRIKKNSRDCPYPVAVLAPAPTQPVAWAIFAENGNCRMWTQNKGHADAAAKDTGLPLTELYAAPQPAAQAQPYDQQEMELCHVCGWKGVIPYADGPVCVACEHDKPLSPQPTAQALDKDEAKAQRLTEKRWLDVSFISEGDMAAREQEDVGGWRRAGALLYRLTSEHRTTNFDEIRVTMANGSRDIGQMSVQAERLLVMLTAPQPAAQAQEDVPDMFWDADDTENFAHEIQDIVDGYGPGEIVTIECAKRMPNLKVLVTRDGDGVSYEHIAACKERQHE